MRAYVAIVQTAAAVGNGRVDALARLAQVAGAGAAVVGARAALLRRLVGAFAGLAQIQRASDAVIHARAILRRVRAAARGVAAVQRTRVAVVAAQAGVAQTLALGAFVAAGAVVAVVASRAGQRLLFARSIGITATLCAWVAVFAQAVVGLAVAVVVQAIADFGFGRRGIALRFAIDASAQGTVASAKLIGVFARRRHVEVVRFAIAIVVDRVAFLGFGDGGLTSRQPSGAARAKATALPVQILVAASGL